MSGYGLGFSGARAAAAAHRAQTQAWPCKGAGTRASNSGVNTAVRHQHGVSNEPLQAGAQALGPPHSGQIGAASGVVEEWAEVSALMDTL